jgi:putative endonuclease
VGFTSNLEERLLSHNQLATKGWTIRFRPWKLVEAFQVPDKKEALRLEKFFKSGKGREKIQIILREKGFKEF